MSRSKFDMELFKLENLEPRILLSSDPVSAGVVVFPQDELDLLFGMDAETPLEVVQSTIPQSSPDYTASSLLEENQLENGSIQVRHHRPNVNRRGLVTPGSFLLRQSTNFAKR